MHLNIFRNLFILAAIYGVQLFLMAVGMQIFDSYEGLNSSSGGLVFQFIVDAGLSDNLGRLIIGGIGGIICGALIYEFYARKSRPLGAFL